MLDGLVDAAWATLPVGVVFVEAIALYLGYGELVDAVGPRVVEHIIEA